MQFAFIFVFTEILFKYKTCWGGLQNKKVTLEGESWAEWIHADADD